MLSLRCFTYALLVQGQQRDHRHLTRSGEDLLERKKLLVKQRLIGWYIISMLLSLNMMSI